MTSQTGAADRGLFGPGSVTWRIMDDPVLLIAGMRALYLQALHPDVMLGTWQNTALADRGQAWGRFARTTEFVRVRTFGTMPEVERAARRIRKVHSALTGVAPDGRVFRLDQPDLLLWVHCGEIASYADVARRCGMPVSAADLDPFVAEQVRSAEIIGLDAGLVPASMADLDAYYEQVRPRLHATPEARQALRRSFTPALAAGGGGPVPGPAVGQHAGPGQPAPLGAADVRRPGQPGHRPGRHRRAAGRLGVDLADPAPGALPAAPAARRGGRAGPAPGPAPARPARGLITASLIR